MSPPLRTNTGGVAISRLGGGVEAVVRTDWAWFLFGLGQANRLAVPSELEAAITARGIQIAEWKDYDLSKEQSEQIDPLRS